MYTYFNCGHFRSYYILRLPKDLHLNIVDVVEKVQGILYPSMLKVHLRRYHNMHAIKV
jgi:hypothetical protein